MGHTISADGFRPPPEKVEAIISFPKPADLTALKRYLGMLNFYRRFLTQCAELLKPLNSFLAGKNKQRNRSIQWSTEAGEAFEQSKRVIADATMLTYPIRDAVTFICSDASNIAVGAVQQQRVDGVERPLAFFSRAMTRTEQRYSLIESYYLFTLLCVTVTIFWKVVSSRSSPIISR